MLIKFNSFRPHYFVNLSVSAVTSNNLRVNEKKIPMLDHTVQNRKIDHWIFSINNFEELR